MSSSISIFSKDQDIIDSILRNCDQIKEELNVKSVKTVDRIDDILEYEIKPNFSNLRSRFGDDMNKSISEINKLDASLIAKSLGSDKVALITIDGNEHPITETDLLITEKARDNYSIATNKAFAVGIDTRIDKELEMEGNIRDIIRFVQNYRKELGFEVNDRINVSFSSSSHIMISISNFEDYFMNETLTYKILTDLSKMEHHSEFSVSGHEVKIGVSKKKE